MTPQRLTLDNPAFAGVRLKTSRGAYGSCSPVARQKPRANYGNDYRGYTPAPKRLGISPPTPQSAACPQPTQSHQNCSEGMQGSPVRWKTSGHSFAANYGPDVRGSAPATVKKDRLEHAYSQSRQSRRSPLTSETQSSQSMRPNNQPQKKRVIARLIHRREMLTIRSWQPALFYGMAGLIFVMGVVVAVGGMQANNHVAAQVKTLQKAAAGATDADVNNGTVPPSAEKPSVQAVSRYTVAPDMPRYVSIPKLGVFSRVFSMGINEKSQLEAPKNIYDAGWYNDSSRPGMPGAMLIDGHSGIGKTNGVFHNVGKLARGDKIVIERGDGQSFMYSIVSVEVLKVDAVDMSTMITPAEKANEGLNLITCTGKLIPGTTSLDQRVLVRAIRNT